MKKYGNTLGQDFVFDIYSQPYLNRVFHLSHDQNRKSMGGSRRICSGKVLKLVLLFCLNGNPLIIYCFFNRHKKIFQKLYGDSALTIPNDDFETKSGIAMGEMK